MYLLDTNVLSETMRPAAALASWMREQPSSSLYTAAMCRAEILAGIAVLSKGRRRAELQAMAEAIFDQDFSGRVLPFDARAAASYAELFAARRQTGRSIATPDLIVAAVAHAHRATPAASRDAASLSSIRGGRLGCEAEYQRSDGLWRIVP